AGVGLAGVSLAGVSLGDIGLTRLDLGIVGLATVGPGRLSLGLVIGCRLGLAGLGRRLGLRRWCSLGRAHLGDGRRGLSRCLGLGRLGDRLGLGRLGLRLLGFSLGGWRNFCLGGWRSRL